MMDRDRICAALIALRDSRQEFAKKKNFTDETGLHSQTVYDVERARR